MEKRDAEFVSRVQNVCKVKPLHGEALLIDQMGINSFFSYEYVVSVKKMINCPL